MKKRHIAFINFPHSPHVNPTLPIASVLARRGHRVTYVTSAPFATRVSAIGAEVVSCPALDVPALLDKIDESEPYQHPFCRHAVKTLAAIKPFYDENRPDLIVYDLVAFAGRILATKLRVPAAQTSPHFALNRENLARQLKDPVYRKGLLEASDQVDSFLERYGVMSRGFLFHRERLNIYLFPKALQPDGTVFQDSLLWAGRCAAEQPSFGEWKHESAGTKPIALVSTSTTYLRGPDYFRMCVEALKPLGFHILLSIGDYGDRQSLMPLPEHVEIIQHTAHINVLRYADLFLFLGGTASTSEAVYHGVPLVVTTHGFAEQEWFGENLMNLGVGIHLRKQETNAENLRAAALRATSDLKILARVKSLQLEVRREPGGEETASRLEDYLEGSSAIPENA